MRVPFCSLTFATQSAKRLATLLPSLSLEQAKNWAAKVYGYAGWDDLESEVAKVHLPVLLALEPDARFAVDAYQAGRSGLESEGRTEFQILTLEHLLGRSRRAAEKLYVTWEPRRSGVIVEDRLVDLGPGSAAFHLMQTNIMELFDSDAGTPPAVTGFNGAAGLVYLGFPGTAAERQTQIAGFIAKLATREPQAEHAGLAAVLERKLTQVPSVRPYGADGTFAQVHPMTFFACLEAPERELVGAGAATFAFIASRDGSHSVKVSVEHVALLPHDELLYAMSESIAVTVWEAVVRYLWCVVGDPVAQARVVVEYPAGDIPATQCAVDAWEQIIDCCGWRLENGEAVFGNIRFELSDKGGAVETAPE